MTTIKLAALCAAALGLCASTLSPGLAAAQDAGHGAKVFSSICGTCHSVANPPKDVVGPSLLHVVGRKAGTENGFKYSKAMASAGFTWTPDQLQSYVASPQKVVPGNRMPFGGLPNPKDRADLVAFLQGQK